MKPLFKTKDYPELGLKVWKYTRDVFFKNRWNEDPMLVEYRGLVTDMKDRIVSYPFTKCFNLGENGTTVDPEREVICPRKVNGFMGVATWYNGELLISTSGTLDSDFVGYAKEYIKDIPKALEMYTFMFEIVHPKDPHIVPEEVGAWLIGVRRKQFGSGLLSERMLDDIAERYGFKRPEVWKGKFKDLPLDVQHEGYMVRDAETGETLCKIKSKHYLFTKFWMRGKKAYRHDQVEEEFFDIVTKIRKTFTFDEWTDLDSQLRRAFIERYFEERE
jgi:hypothetical protein